MNDKVRYLVEMEPNMITGIALFRLTFHRGGMVHYDYLDGEGVFQVLDEIEWNALPHDRMAEVNEGIVEVWKQEAPLGYDTVAKYVV